MLAKLSRKASILRIVGLGLIVASFVTFLIFTSQQGDKIQEQKSLIVKKDSVISEIDHSVKLTDTLQAITKRYLTLRMAHKADSLEGFYADTVIQYFKNLQYVPKRMVTESDRRFWRRFPDERFLVTDSVQIQTDAVPYTALVKGQECRSGKKCVEQIMEIRFDRERKINYVRAFYSN